MIIEVTQEDIDKGKPHHRMSCPVALALNRQLGTRTGRWSVDGRAADTAERTIYLPDVVGKWVSAFDHELPVPPITFEVADDWDTDVEDDA